MPDSVAAITPSSSPLKIIKDYTTTIQNQGIVTILRSDFELPTHPAVSLRRTLSADMSSNKWLSRHGFSAIKKVASSDGFSVSLADSSSEGEEDCDDVKEASGRGGVEFWSSVGEDEKMMMMKKKIESQKKGEFDTWSSILSHNSADAPKSVAVPYVHPFVKKSTSSLSEKSLEICTESLGSETGSDGFSSYPPSEVGDMDEEMKQDPQPETFEWREWRPIKFSHKKSPPRSFPPPLSSLSCPDGASVCMKSRRENGRLILDAVSVPSQKNFCAYRRDGRLVLSFITAPPSQNEQSVEEEEEELEELLARDFEEVKESEIDDEKDDEINLEAEELEIPMAKAPRLSSSVMNFHRLALMVKKPNGLVNRNPPWPNDLNDIVQLQKEKDAPEPPTPLAQSLPPRPPTLATATATAAASLNAYEYYWRSKPTGKSATIQNPIGQQQPQPIKSVTRKIISSNNPMTNEKQQILVLRGNRGDYLVPLLSNGCKVPRRSLLLREPCCIATT